MLLFPVGESEVPEWYAFDDGSIYRFESDNSFTLNTCSGSYETSGDLIILNYSCGNSETVTVEYIVNFESGNLILTPNTSSCDEAGFCALKLQKID